MDNNFSSSNSSIYGSSRAQATLLLNLADAISGARETNFALDASKTQAALGYQLAQLGERLGDHKSYLTMFEPTRSGQGQDRLLNTSD